MENRDKRFRTFIFCLFIIYLLVLLLVVFFFPVRERSTKTYEYSVIPLQNILHQIHDPAQYNTPDYWFMFAVSIAGNFFLFIPFGFLGCLLFTEKTKLNLFFCGVGISILIEMMQLIFHAGVCDIDDVILNSLGTGAGIVLCNLFFCLQKTRLHNTY